MSTSTFAVRRLGALVAAALCLVSPISPRIVSVQAAPAPAEAEVRTATDVAAPAPELAQRSPATGYGVLPMSFEPNVGQTDSQVRFLARGNGYALHLTGREAILSVTAGSRRDSRPTSSRISISWIGGSDSPRVLAGAELPGTANYLIGDDPKKWHTNIPTYSSVRYQSVYPGVDLVYYGRDGEVEYDFVVAPRVDPSVIRVRIDGAESMRVDEDGNLRMRVAGGEMVQKAPVLYQEQEGQRIPVDGRYRLGGDGEVGFDVGSYDRSAPLVIDPILVYSNLFGGGAGPWGWDQPDESLTAMAVDSSGAVYVVGWTEAIDFPLGGLPAPLEVTIQGAQDAFVAKISPSGDALEYATYLGGRGYESAYGVAVDSFGNAYVTGAAGEGSFPGITAASIQGTQAGEGDSFLVKLDPTGSDVLWGTYLGGSGYDMMWEVALTPSGDVVVAGSTLSPDFPATSASSFQQTIAGYAPWVSYYAADLAVVKVAGDGSSILASTYYGGLSSDWLESLAIDAAGDIYIAGETYSTGLPGAAASPIQPTPASSNDAFVVKLSGDCSSLAFATYLGGQSSDRALAIDVDAAGNVFVGGFTQSANFPVAGAALQSALNGYGDGWLAKIVAGGTSLAYSSYYGGSSYDTVEAITVDTSGTVYIAGVSESTNIPGAASSPLQPAPAGGFDAFVARIDLASATSLYATYYGGSNEERLSALAVDAAGNMYLAGDTRSPDLPTAEWPSSIGPELRSYTDGFVAKISAAGNAVSYMTYLGGSIEASRYDEGFGVAVDASGAVYVAGSTESVDFPITTGAFAGWHSGAKDGFVTKLDPTGTSILYSTYFGGSNDEWTKGVAVDSAGQVVVTGMTGSAFFPGAHSSPIQSTLRDYADAFVLKLNASGSGVVFGTYLGSNAFDQGYGVAYDAAGNVYVTGSASGSGFKTTASAFDTSYGGGQDGFVAKIDPTGSSLLYSSYFGGSDSDVGTAITVDASGNAYVAGGTSSTSLPGPGGASLQPANAGGGDACLLKVNDTGSAVLYSTFLGGSALDSARGIAFDPAGNILVSGVTDSPNFPVTGGALQTSLAGGTDGFVTKLTPDGLTRLYGTYLGGAGDDQLYGLGVDGDGLAAVAGWTTSAAFPLVNPVQAAYGGGFSDMFAAKLAADGSGLAWSTYLGGEDTDLCYGMATDAAGSVYITGSTHGPSFPSSGSNSLFLGLTEVVVAKIGEEADLSVQVSESSDPATTNSGLTYTVTVSNAGPDAASGVVLATATPAGTTFASAATTQGTLTAPAAGAAGAVSCAVGRLEAGASVTLTLVVNVTAAPGATLALSASASTSDTDAATGNNEASAQTSVVTDCTIVTPANITVGSGAGASECGAVVSFPAPTTSGGCGTVTCAPASGSLFPIGTTTVTCSTEAGPSSTFTVTVVDDTPPAISCPASVTADAPADSCSAVVTWAPPSASDACGTASISCTPASGSSFPVGTTTVTCTATDAVGNVSTCSFGVTVRDTTAPSISCPASVSVVTTSASGAVVTYPAPSASDACGVASVTCAPASGTTFPVGTTTVTCTAADAAGNASSCSFTVTIEQEFVVNGGFEAGVSPWVQSTTGIINNTAGTASAGTWGARLLGRGRNTTHWLRQSPGFGSTGATRTLTFWLKIVSTEGTTRAKDYLYVRITNASDATLATLATFSNVHKTTYGSYAQVTLSIPAQYAVSGNRLRFHATENNSAATSFYLDDVSIR